MELTRRIKIQLAIFATIALSALTFMTFGVMHAPSRFFGVGRYNVTLQLPQAGGLYPSGNVTYRGVEVGRVKSVSLTDTGAEAVLSMQSGIDIPAKDLAAEVHSVSAVGEQYVALTPHSQTGPALKDGDVIPKDRTHIPPDINSLLAAANRGVNAIPKDNLKTVVDEGYVAVGGLGPELSRLVKGVDNVSAAARRDKDELVALIDGVKPVLDSFPADSVQGWASHLETVTKQLQNNDSALAGLLQKAPATVDEARSLLDRLSPTLPIVLANLVSVGPVLITYRADLEALLVELPMGTADAQGILVPNMNTKQDYVGANLSFNLNINLPPACTTGFLPAQQIRSASLQDYPDVPRGDLYCRVPQDSVLNVRGAKNYPCETKPGKRAPTAAMCESDEQYVPLNDGFNWKGDANATYTGQSVPQIRTGEAPPPAAPPGQAPPPRGPPPPPIAAVQYDPATGNYVGPDGHVYTQSNLAQGASKERTWQQMLIPPEVELSDSAAVEEAADYDATIEDRSDVYSDEAAPVGQSTSHVRLATLVGLIAIVGLATLVGWQGFKAYQLDQAQERRQLFVEVGRQGALNLTTIDWQHADADVKRVLDSATGTFFDDFSKRQQPFIEVVKKAQAISKGTITEAGLESESGDEAQVLVAVSVKTSNIGAAEQAPRAWRMRISVQKSGDDAKVSNVAFVP